MIVEKERWDKVAIEYSKKVEDKDSQGFLIREKCLNPYLFKTIGNVSNKEILDYGCGEGWLCNDLRQKGANVLGVDISEEFIKIAKQKFPEINFEVIEDKIFCPNNKFDGVICNIVLHTTERYKQIIDEIYRVLKPRGKAIITIMHPQVWKEELINLQKDEEVLDVTVEKTVPVKYYRRIPEIYENKFEEVGFKSLAKQECMAKDKMPRGLEKYNKDSFFLLWKLEKGVKCTTEEDYD